MPRITWTQDAADALESYFDAQMARTHPPLEPANLLPDGTHYLDVDDERFESLRKTAESMGLRPPTGDVSELLLRMAREAMGGSGKPN